jgi:precorrin-8X/cobalt-precorrin-8 methylmutase
VDHPIFTESVRRIRHWLGPTGLEGIEQEVLERLVHSSGDLTIAPDLRCGPGACEAGLAALAAGAPILTDTAMARAAVLPMARRTFANPVHSVLEWAPAVAPAGGTRTAEGMDAALEDCPGAVVLIGSAPTALERLLDRQERALAAGGAIPSSRPALVIGMPVGFVGVAESKRRLAASPLPQIRLEGSRGGAGLVAAACNALLRHAWLQTGGGQASRPAAPPAPRVPVAVGELIDKLTILEIKGERIADPAGAAHVRREHDLLRAVLAEVVLDDAGGMLATLAGRLRAVNERLWDVEDAIRTCERDGRFGPEFVDLARSVYRLNDERAAIKRTINRQSGSELVEQKLYAAY